METISKEGFKNIYDSALDETLKIVKLDREFREELALHNWAFLEFDFKDYLEKSWIRYYYAYKMIHEKNPDSNLHILDVGGFFGVFALTLNKIGYVVSISEKYSFYGKKFDKLRGFIESNNVEVLDFDFVSDTLSSDHKEYDVITCMAMIEHIAHSPKILMNNIKKSLKKGGILILDVPNIAFWGNRLKLLIGRNILPKIEVIYKSKIPFTGHHHEYTIDELRSLAELTDLKLDKLFTFNYARFKGKRILLLPVFFPMFFFNSLKDTIICRYISEGD